MRNRRSVVAGLKRQATPNLLVGVEAHKETGMIHHHLDASSLTRVLEVLNEEGFEGVALALELLMNEA